MRWVLSHLHVIDEKTEALSRELGQSRANIQSHALLMLDSFIFLSLPSLLSLTNRRSPLPLPQTGSLLTPAPISHPLLPCCDADGLKKPVSVLLCRVSTQL